MAKAIAYVTSTKEALEPLQLDVKSYQQQVLKDFSLTVKAATLIFISGRGLAISSAKQGKSGSIYNLVKSCLGSTNVHAFHENPYRLHTELTFINL